MAYAVVQTVRSHLNEEEGYEDGADNRRAAMHITAELALYVAALGGTIGDAEAKIIKDWMSVAASHIPEDMQKEEKELFKKAVNDAYRRACAGQLDLNEILGRMNASASIQEKYEALEVCMDVMAADGKAEQKEIEALDRLAQLLRVDIKTYRSLREQRLAKVTDVGEVKANLNTMLGITPDMTPDQVKEHLVAEYRKWNSRVSHSDEKVRERASKMLLLIGEARAKYVD
jgi:hypothetical protein